MLAGDREDKKMKTLANFVCIFFKKMKKILKLLFEPSWEQMRVGKVELLRQEKETQSWKQEKYCFRFSDTLRMLFMLDHTGHREVKKYN